MLPPISIAEARRLAVRLRLAGDVQAMDYEVYVAALLVMDDYARQLETTMVEQHDSINELTETIDRYLARDAHPSSQPTEVTGVHWQGPAMAYAENMEAINKELSIEIGKVIPFRGPNNETGSAFLRTTPEGVDATIKVDWAPDDDHPA